MSTTPKETPATDAPEIDEADVRDIDFWSSDPSDVPPGPVHVFNTQGGDGEDYKAFARAADIAHNVAATIPPLVRAANADPIDAAHMLWRMLTGILLDAGWSACDLSDEAHEIQAEYAEIDGEEGPEDGEAIH